MATALYRKYRPATFAEVVGQTHVTEPLIHAVDNGRINHAYLFSGPRGCGKTSSARILARSLNCVQGPTATPCGECDSCVGLAPDGAGTPDVIEIDAASHGGVDDARDLRDRAFYAPMVSRYKIYIIDEAHMVTTQGFNALLKLVEEPPDFLVFVFATTEPDKVLPTIRSRTHHYPFRLMAPSVMRALLSRICGEERATVEETVYPLVVRAGGGSARDALSIMDQLLAGAGDEGVTYRRAVDLLGVTDAALLDEMVDALAAGDAGSVFGAVERVAESGHDPRRFTADLLDRLRDLVILDAVPDAGAKGMLELSGDQLTTMADQAHRLGTATLSRLGDIVHEGLTEMRGTTAPRLLLELLCARMLLPTASGDGAAMLQRLERLERRLQINDAEPKQRTAAPAAAPAAATPAAPTPRAERPATTRSAATSSTKPTEAGVAQSDTTPSASVPADQPASTADRRQPGSGSAEAPEPTAPSELTAPSEPTAPPEPTATPLSEPTAESAEPAAPAAPAGRTGSASELTSADLRRLWPDLLESIKARKRTTHALLMSANVLGVQASTLTLGINSSGLMRRLSEDINTEIIRAALSEKLGVSWQVKVVVDTGNIEQDMAETPAETPAEPPQDPASSPGGPSVAVTADRSAVSGTPSDRPPSATKELRPAARGSARAADRDGGAEDTTDLGEPVEAGSPGTTEDTEQAMLKLLRSELGAAPIDPDRRPGASTA